MHCVVCGYEINEDSNFCENCGASVLEPDMGQLLRKTNTNKKPKRKRKKYRYNKKRVYGAIIGLIVVCAAVVTFVLLPEDEDPVVLRQVQDKTNEYLLLNMDKNAEFEIKSKGGKTPTYKIVETGKGPVSTTLNGEGGTAVIKPPKGGYYPGKIYTITLGEKSVFTNTQYAQAKVLHFKINRAEVAKTRYKDDVRVFKKGEAEIKAHSVRLSENCEAGDVIVVQQGDGKSDVPCKIKGSVVIRGETTATFEEPKIDELYQDVNIHKTVISNAKHLSVNKGVVLETAKKMDLFGLFIEDVSGLTEKDIEAKVCQSDDNKIDVTIVVHDPNAKKRSITLDFSVKYKAQIDIQNQQQFMDCQLELAEKMDISLQGEQSEALQNEVESAIADFEKSQDSKLETNEKTGSEAIFDIFTVQVPIQDTIDFFFDFDAGYNLTTTGSVNAGLTSKFVMNHGVFVSDGKVELQYANVKSQLKGPVILQGKTESRTGFTGEMGVKFLGDSSISFVMEPEIQTDMKGYVVAQDVSKFNGAKGYYSMLAGTRMKDTLHVNMQYQDSEVAHRKRLISKKLDAVNKSNIIKVEGVNLKDKYAYKDGKINLGKLSAAYQDIIEERNYTEEIENYRLYVDNKKVDVKNGVVQSKIEEGEHTFKLKWKYKGQKEEYERTVRVVESFDFDVVTALGYKNDEGNILRSIDVDIEIPKVKKTTENADDCNEKINRYCKIGRDMAEALDHDYELPANYGSIKSFSSYRWYYEVYRYKNVTALVMSSIVRGRNWGGWDTHYALYYDNSTGELMSPGAYAEAAGYSTKEVLKLAKKGKGKSKKSKVYVPSDIGDYEDKGTTFFVNDQGRLNVRYGVSLKD